jgi:hypothetical protein
MARACTILAAAMAVFAIGVGSTADAASGTAPFACNAGRGRTATCFFKLFLGPTYTRIVQLPANMTVSIPNVNIGSDRYCVSMNTTPLPTCVPTVIKATLNN